MTQPISHCQSLVRERQRTGLCWRRLRGARASLNLRFSTAGSRSSSPSTGDVMVAMRRARHSRFARAAGARRYTKNAGDSPRRGHQKSWRNRRIIRRYYWRRVRPGARRDIYLLLTQPGADGSHPSRGSVEHIIVTQGKALVGLTEAPEELAEGDYICYPGDPGAYL